VDGDILWRAEMEAPFETHDPLRVWMLPLHKLAMTTPEPGM
jgi:hypothetical protein